MNLTLGIILLLNTVFNLFAWPTFFRRVAKDPRARDAAGRPTTFFTVHLVLLIVAMVLAAASLVGAIVAFVSA